MKVPVELSLAMRYLRPRRTFVSVITVLSFMGVAVGVMVLIVVLSVMTGFRQRLDDKIIGFNAHITVSSDDVIYNSDKAIALIDKQPGVVAASPVVFGPVMIEVHNSMGLTRMTPGFIKNAPEDGEDPVLPLKKFLTMGDYELHGDSVLVGKEWSKRNSVFPGDAIDIYGGGVLQSLMEQQQNPGKNKVIVMPDEPIIRGIFQTGQFAYDSEYFLVSTAMAQHIYGLGEGVQGIAVRVKDPDQAEEIKNQLNKILPAPLIARTWMDNNRDLFNALAIERVVMTFILLMVMLVAGFGLCSTLITITVQKSREIGLMKALGANDLQVCSVFLLHSLIVGVVGALSGTVLGLLVLQYRNPFRDLLLKYFGVQAFAPSVYGQTDIPAVVNPTSVVVIAIAGIVICLLAAFFPALNAAKLAPARALRYE